ncbi:MAG TPA: hypothetical protein VG889_07305 [Rhizomicrobium sp.]|nr:hypothetical protein [Rhizomicrobium sp.]
MDFTRLTQIPLRDPDEDDEAMVALRETVAVLDAISYGELFAALPDNPSDRVRHQTGIVLLDMLRDRLKQSVRDP